MISIVKATSDNYKAIVEIGKVSVADAHKGSCPDEALQQYIQNNYNDEAIQKEVNNPEHIYHIIYIDQTPVGFSKIVFNATHSNVPIKNVAKLDRIYLLIENQGRGLGYKLLNFNIDLSKRENQAGIWLFTWVGNQKAINFYNKVGFKIVGSHQFFVTPTASNLNHQLFLEFI